MHAHIFEFIGFIFQMAVLAVVLGVVGFYVNKFISTKATRSHESKVNSAAFLARSRAQARQAH